MSQREFNKIEAFDSLYTTNQICKLKVMLPYFDISLQKKMAIYIKYLEFQYTIEYFKRFEFSNQSASLHPSFDTKSFLTELIPYCTKEEQTQMRQMEQLFANFENYKSMIDNLTMIKEMFPDNDLFNGTNSGDINFDDLSSMMQMFQGLNI